MKLSQLKEAFAPISQIGLLEKTISVHGVEIVIKTLNSRQEAEVQKKLSALNEEEELSALEYVDHFRKETLTRAISSVGGVSFQDEYVETGEVLENGTPIKIPRVEALRGVLDELSRAVLNEIFMHLAELSKEAEGESEESVDKSSESLEEQEQVLTSKLEQVQRQKNHQEVMDISAETISSNYDDALKNMG